jgi:hypothetical protein
MQILTVELEDRLYQALKQIAQQLAQTPEQISAQWIANAVERIECDPLLALAGTLECDVTDVGERHDHYIGQALLAEMRGNENA